MPPIGDAVSRFDVRDARPTASTTPSAFLPRGERRRNRIEADAVVDLDKVQPDRGVAHAHLIGTRFADLDGFPLQDFRSAGGVDPDSVCHGYFSHSVGRHHRPARKKCQSRGVRSGDASPVSPARR